MKSCPEFVFVSFQLKRDRAAQKTETVLSQKHSESQPSVFVCPHTFGRLGCATVEKKNLPLHYLVFCNLHITTLHNTSAPTPALFCDPPDQCTSRIMEKFWALTVLSVGTKWLYRWRHRERWGRRWRFQRWRRLRVLHPERLPLSTTTTTRFIIIQSHDPPGSCRHVLMNVCIWIIMLF